MGYDSRLEWKVLTVMSKEKNDDKRSCIECRGIMIRLEMTSKTLNSTVGRLTEGMSELVELIKGNGEPGINERLRVVEARERGCSRSSRLWFDRIWKILVSVGVGALLLHMRWAF